MDKPSSQVAAGCKPLTTFVQTNTNSFRDVVQQLTGPSETCAIEVEAAKCYSVKRTTSKLHERRQYTRPKLEIVKPAFHSKYGVSANHHCFSPSRSRDSNFPPSPESGSSNQLPSPKTPSTLLSRLTILEEEKKERSAIPDLNREEEEKAIKERKFYLHPSLRPKPGFAEPELLSLFPLTSLDKSGRVV